MSSREPWGKPAVTVHLGIRSQGLINPVWYIHHPDQYTFLQGRHVFHKREQWHYQQNSAKKYVPKTRGNSEISTRVLFFQIARHCR